MIDIDEMIMGLRASVGPFNDAAADALVALREEARRERHAAEMCQKANASLAEEHIALREENERLKEQVASGRQTPVKDFGE